MSRKKTVGGDGVLRGALLAKLLQGERRADALVLARKILVDEPDHALALRTCVDAELQLGRFEQALPLCARLAAVQPDDVMARMKYGLCLGQTRQLKASHEQLLAAESLSADEPDVCGHLSTSYFLLNDFERSLYYADKAIAGAPTNYSAHNARGASLLKLERYEEALLALAKAIDLYPGEYYEEAVNNLGLALHDMRQYAQAYTCHEEILRIAPDDTGSLPLLVHSALQICRWDKLDGWRDTLLKWVRSASPPVGMAPFAYLAVPGMTREDHLRMAKLAAETNLPLEIKPKPSLADLPLLLPRRQKLRIGYLSADFHQHATSQLMVEVLEHHDRDLFEIFGYSTGPDDQSPMRVRVKNAFDHFHDIRELTWVAASERIVADHIDILVDLKGWTHATRMEILAERPAPIIVSWLGYPGTLGHPDMADYIVGDPYVTPLEHAEGYSESIIQLPHSYQPNDRHRLVGEMPSRQSLDLPESAVVFCSFNQAYKINREIFFAWCDILRQVPGSVLWLLKPDDVAMENLRCEATERGIDASRLIFAPKCELTEHLGRLQQASLALDTAPYGSHTTGSDALWVGVPMITCPGKTFASRVAASLLAAAGVPELITPSMETYVELAVRLGRNPDELEALREKIRKNRQICPLFDSARFTRNLEKAYAQAVEDGRAGIRRAIQVEDVGEVIEAAVPVRPRTGDAFSRLLCPARLTEVVDIGANPIDGTPPYTPLLAAGICRVTGFEPQADALDRLLSRKGPHETYLPFAVGDGAEHTLHLCAASGMASLFEPDERALSLFDFLKPLGDVVEKVPLQTRKLDDIDEIRSVDFLKIDIRGGELAVFRNGVKKLSQAVVVQCEVSFVTLYKGQPVFGEIDLELRRQGFIPHCFADVKQWAISPCEINGDPRIGLNQLLEADIVYVRDFSRSELMGDEQLKHLALIAHHCYQSVDLALKCVKELESRGVLPSGSQEQYLQLSKVVGGLSFALKKS